MGADKWLLKDGYSEYYYLKDVFLAYGLPPLKESDYPPCGVTALNGGCSSDGTRFLLPFLVLPGLLATDTH